jgi:hypothetical protein
MHWFLWVLLSNGGIMWLEYQYRNGTYNHFFPALPYIFIPILMGQVGLFYGFRGAPNLLLAGATFTVINVALRIVNSYLLGEAPNLYNWTGVVLLVIATLLLKVK